MNLIADALFGRAECYIELNETNKAIEELSRIINHFEQGNIDRLEDEFMSRVYNLRGKCLTK